MARWPRLLPFVAFHFHLEHGRCVGVRLPDAEGIIHALAEATLAPEERAFAAGLTAVRRRTWVGGRVAMREALATAGVDAPPILSDARGAPVLPPGIAGSISHKERLAVAIVARGAARVGVDVEIDAASAPDIR
jgi:4'-phosphopantetheinyl transferase EntD